MFPYSSVGFLKYTLIGKSLTISVKFKSISWITSIVIVWRSVTHFIKDTFTMLSNAGIHAIRNTLEQCTIKPKESIYFIYPNLSCRKCNFIFTFFSRQMQHASIFLLHIGLAYYIEIINQLDKLSVYVIIH